VRFGVNMGAARAQAGASSGAKGPPKFVRAPSG